MNADERALAVRIRKGFRTALAVWNICCFLSGGYPAE